MRDRYEGEGGDRRLLEQMRLQHSVLGNEALAQALLGAGEPVFPVCGETVIEQGAATNDVYFVVSGQVHIVFNGRHIATRNHGRTVGEMSAINPAIARSATVIAGDNTVLVKVSEPRLSEIAEAHPQLWRRFAIDLAERLEQRNAMIRPCNKRPLVFVICATEALPIAQAIQFSFEHDEADFRIWSDEVFRASQYPIEALEAVMDEADFAIAIASPEDITNVRGSSVKQPRDNVLVELGMAIGKLGRRRSNDSLIPRDETVQLPSDFKGLTPIAYQDGERRPAKPASRSRLSPNPRRHP